MRDVFLNRMPISEESKAQKNESKSKKSKKKDKDLCSIESKDNSYGRTTSVGEESSDFITINVNGIPQSKIKVDLPCASSKGSAPVVAASIPRVQQLPQHMRADNDKVQKKHASKLAKRQLPKRIENKQKMPLFSHLVQIERNANLAGNISLSQSSVHPCFITFGIQMADEMFFHTSERCCKLIDCLITFITDYHTPNDKDIFRDFQPKLSISLTFLSQCRPLSSGMGTIIKLLKDKFSECSNLQDNEIKTTLIQFLYNFRNERIELAREVIVATVTNKIFTDDVILTYSMSEIVLNALIKASQEEKVFKVIIVDSKPRFDSRKMLHRLIESKIECCYIGLNGLSVVMNQVTKIIIEATAILVNGAVMCPVGSALISVVGKSKNVPFLVCCETYNFSERAQTDAFVYNELGDPDDIITCSGKNVFKFEQWKQFQNVTLLNIHFDVINPKYVDAIITELGIIPCSSAPVVLRVKN